MTMMLPVRPLSVWVFVKGTGISGRVGDTPLETLFSPLPHIPPAVAKQPEPLSHASPGRGEGARRSSSC